jgi:hypothetical protein
VRRAKTASKAKSRVHWPGRSGRSLTRSLVSSEVTFAVSPQTTPPRMHRMHDNLSAPIVYFPHPRYSFAPDGRFRLPAAN